MEKINPYNIDGNVFRLLDKDWMLITAGRPDDFNTMTASWGGFGILWHRPIAIIFVRPPRYTFQFLEKYDFFTLCFFNNQFKNILNFCGKYSGRDTNKIAKTGLLPLETPAGNIYFEQARLILECRKIYLHDISPEKFLDRAIETNYPEKDFHRMYIGEIENSWINNADSTCV